MVNSLSHGIFSSHESLTVSVIKISRNDGAGSTGTRCMEPSLFISNPVTRSIVSQGLPRDDLEPKLWERWKQPVKPRSDSVFDQSVNTRLENERWKEKRLTGIHPSIVSSGLVSEILFFGFTIRFHLLTRRSCRFCLHDPCNRRFAPKNGWTVINTRARDIHTRHQLSDSRFPVLWLMVYERKRKG